MKRYNHSEISAAGQIGVPLILMRYQNEAHLLDIKTQMFKIIVIRDNNFIVVKMFKLQSGSIQVVNMPEQNSPIRLTN